MRPLSKTGNYISTRIGRAIQDYKLIEDKDRILVAVSGGKDSMALLKLLNERKKWAPVSYELIAMHVVTDFKCANCNQVEKLKSFFKDMKVKSHFKKIKVAGKDKKLSCFWCSWNRRKALFMAADKFKCNKVALGHHKDDIVETMLLNIFYHGEFAAMNPRQELFGGKVTIIRPLCYVEEETMRKFARESRFAPQVCGCPNSETSRRRMMKDFIKKVERSCPHVRTNLMRCISRVKHDYINIAKDTAFLSEGSKLDKAAFENAGI
jgi:tRNA 2-thiocytidine biosynthesis protein TtcA